VHGDSLHDFCMLFIVVDEEKVKSWAKTNSLDFDDKLMENDLLREQVYSDVLELAAKNKLNSLEKPKQMMLLKDPWTIEDDILTPTLKMKRNIAKKRYESDITRMYDAGAMTTT